MIEQTKPEEPFRARLLSRPPSLCFIGDSHVEIFSGLLFKAQRPARLFQTQSHNHHYFRAAEFTTTDGVLNERLSRSMIIFGYLRTTQGGDGNPLLPQLTTSRSQNAIVETLKPRQESLRSVLVISCGEIDSREILSKIPADADFLLPFSANIPLERALPLQHIQTDMLTTFILGNYLNPLRDGLRLMRSMGFSNIFLHSLAPPTVDDGDSERVQGFYRPANLRYKLTMLLNHLLREICVEVGVHFLDMWQESTTDGLLNSNFYLDGLHLNKAAATLTVNRVLRFLQTEQLIDDFLRGDI